MKVGLIRCLQTEAICPARGCISVMSSRIGAFGGIEEEIILTGVNTCGGCPGKNAVPRATRMVEQGADAIAFSTCVTKGAPVDFSCPHQEQMIEAVRKSVGPDIKIFEYTHD